FFQILLFVLAGVVTFICSRPDLVNSPMVRTAGVLVLAGVLSRDWWIKFARNKWLKHKPDA
ncbi:MAG: hypothetical protein GY850_27455, partial [bacterium]|nr:hypothetical protein [bacterium]